MKKLLKIIGGAFTALCIWFTIGFFSVNADAQRRRVFRGMAGGMAKFVYIASIAQWTLEDEGASQSTTVTTLNCVGGAVACTASGADGTITIASALTTSTVTDSDSPVSASAGNLYVADASSGSITIDAPAAATLGTGGVFAVRADAIGTGFTVTLDPDGSETISGSTTILFEERDADSFIEVRSDGTNLVLASASGGVVRQRFADLSLTRPSNAWQFPGDNDLIGGFTLGVVGDGGNASTAAPAAFRGSVLFDGSSDDGYALATRVLTDMPISAGFSGGDFSAIVWFRCTNAGDANRVIGFYDPTAGDPSAFLFASATGHDWYGDDSVGFKVATSLVARDTGWHMAYVEVDDGTHVGISVDDETLVTTALASNLQTSASNSFRIGYGHNADTNEMEGEIAFVALWPTELLTAANRTSLYNSGSGIKWLD